MKNKKPVILIAPNSYKESIDSVSAANLFYDNLKQLDAEFLLCPLSDGGDGFLNVIRFIKNIELIEYEVSSPWKYIDTGSYNKKIKVPVGLCIEEKKVYIESADVIGMKIIPAEKRQPFLLTTEGLGELLLLIEKDISDRVYDIDKVIIGVGGTGTVDLGLGALSALGLKLKGVNNESLQIIPTNFNKALIAEFEPHEFPFNIELVIDVNNKLFGENGGLRVYSPQKGVLSEQLDNLENDIALIIGLLPFKELSGAGGGIPTGLSLLSKVLNISSVQFLFDDLMLIKLLEKADIIITGEGKYDRQSSFDKASGVILSEKNDIPIFLCCGTIDGDFSSNNVIPVEFTKFFSSETDSIKHVAYAIKLASIEIVQHLSLIFPIKLK